MKFKFSGLIPLLTTPAGSCLTSANWSGALVSTVSCSLESLLLKPGLALLNTVPDLATYFAWSGAVVLNASSLTLDKQDTFTLRSPYDGSMIRHSVDEIFTLIAKLRPNFVILPPGLLSFDSGLWQQLPEGIFPFLPFSDYPSHNEQRPFGVYYDLDKSPDCLAMLDLYSDKPRYVAGTLDIMTVHELVDRGVGFIESDKPAADAYHGYVYSKSGILSLSDTQYEKQFELIDEHCNCPTCSAQFTRAYLHHLLAQTPLLCQRFLIQHNLFYVQQQFR